MTSAADAAEFDPRRHRYGEPKYFEDLTVGLTFYMPSRTITSATFAAFQTVSGDMHASHYDVEFCREKGQPDLAAHGFQIVSLTAPGASDFPHFLGGTIIAFVEQTSRFLKPMFRGDTVYPAIRITELIPQRTTGVLVLASTIHNQRKELIMEGEQRYLVRRRPAA